MTTIDANARVVTLYKSSYLP